MSKSVRYSIAVVLVLAVAFGIYELLMLLGAAPDVKTPKGGKEVSDDVGPKLTEFQRKMATLPKEEALRLRRSALRANPIYADDEFEGLSPDDRKLAEAVQSAMETDDNNAIISASVKALESSNSDVRQAAVDALGWCGKDALVELIGAMADSDESVRDSAINNWECALMELDSAQQRFSAAAMVMGTITQEDALDSISGQFTTAAQEYIDEVDDEAEQNDRRVEVVQKLVDIIDGATSNICAEKAKEAYSDLTGYDWMGIAEAEKYVADPDEYEPPEEE